MDKEESNGRRSKDERCTTPFSLFGKVFLGLVLLFLFKCVDEKAWNCKGLKEERGTTPFFCFC